MFWEAFRVTGQGVLQIFILGIVGYLLVKKNVLGDGCLATLSRLTIDVALPALVFTELLKNFSFSEYPNWWLFPLISMFITLVGFGIGRGLSCFLSGRKKKWQFMNLIAFQNSGWLPLALVTAILPAEQAEVMFIYLFLFMAGFNLALFSIGVFTLTASKSSRFDPRTLVTPPVAAILVTLLVILLGLRPFIPALVTRPLEMIGQCTVPIALLVVGGNLARIRLEQVDKKAMALLLFGKLMLLPAIGLAVVLKMNLSFLVGLLVVMETAVPPATTLSVIVRSYAQDDIVISQGIFLGHIFSLLTLPVFLSLYFTLYMVK